MTERLKVSPLQASIILANELRGSGQYSEEVGRSLHGPKWQKYYHPTEDRPVIRPEQFLEDAQRSQTLIGIIDQMLQQLTDRKRFVVGLRFGQVDGTLHSLSEIASRTGLKSPERQRQIIARELRRLRYPSSVKPLREFLSH